MRLNKKTYRNIRRQWKKSPSAQKKYKAKKTSWRKPKTYGAPRRGKGAKGVKTLTFTKGKVQFQVPDTAQQDARSGVPYTFADIDTAPYNPANYKQVPAPEWDIPSTFQHKDGTTVTAAQVRQACLGVMQTLEGVHPILGAGDYTCSAVQYEPMGESWFQSSLVPQEFGVTVRHTLPSQFYVHARDTIVAIQQGTTELGTVTNIQNIADGLRSQNAVVSQYDCYVAIIHEVQQASRCYFSPSPFMAFQSCSMYDVTHPNARQLLDIYDHGYFKQIVNSFQQYATSADTQTSGYIKMFYSSRLIDAPYWSGGLMPVTFQAYPQAAAPIYEDQTVRKYIASFLGYDTFQGQGFAPGTPAQGLLFNPDLRRRQLDEIDRWSVGSNYSISIPFTASKGKFVVSKGISGELLTKMNPNQMVNDERYTRGYIGMYIVFDNLIVSNTFNGKLQWNILANSRIGVIEHSASIKFRDMVGTLPGSYKYREDTKWIAPFA